MQNDKIKPKKRKKTKKQFIRFIFFGISSFVFLIYFFNLVFEMTTQIKSKYKEKDELNLELIDLKEQEEKLSTDVLKLQDPEYVARYLREKYYYSKENEFIIKLPN